MTDLARELKKAGVASLEVQAKIRAPDADLTAFLAGWPPYDKKMGLVAFTQIGSALNSYRVTLFLGGVEGGNGRRRLILEFAAVPTEKIDLPFERFVSLVEFLRQPRKGFSFSDVRGVVHSANLPKHCPFSFPVPFNDSLAVVGVRLQVKRAAGETSFLENIILERVGKAFHARLATKKFSKADIGGLESLVSRALSCKRDLDKMMR